MAQTANQIAENYLYEVLNSFSIRLEDGSRLPATMQEIEDARALLQKARAANPDDPAIVNWLEEMEALVEEAPKRKWIGSYFICFVLIIFTYLILTSGAFRHVTHMFDWPETSDIQKNIERDIKGMARTFAQIQGLPDSDPSKARKMKAANEQLEQLRNLDPEEVREKEVSEHIKNGFFGMFILIYAPSMLALYIYSARSPQFLIWKRESQLLVMKKSKNIFMRTIWGITKLFLFASKVTFKITLFFPRVHRRTYYPSLLSSPSYGGGSSAGFLLSIFFLLAGLAFFVFVFAFLSNLIFQFAWLFVSFNYLRNYQNDRLEMLKRKIKKRFYDWKQNRKQNFSPDNLVLEELAPLEELPADEESL